MLLKIHWMPMLTICCALAAAVVQPARAVEPTSLTPAEGADPKVFEVEEEVEYLKADEYEVESETELTYGINTHLKIGIALPFEYAEHEDVEFGDVGLFIEGAFNPDADRAPIIGGELRLTLPTGEDSDEVGGEIDLRITKMLGAEKRHGLHLNLMGYYDAVDEERHKLFDHDDSDGEDFRFGAVLGYTFAATDATTLTADVAHEQDYEGSEDANLFELGVAHDFSDSFAAGIGAGVGLDSDSPDFTVKATCSFKFGLGGK